MKKTPESQKHDTKADSTTDEAGVNLFHVQETIAAKPGTAVELM